MNESVFSWKYFLTEKRNDYLRVMYFSFGFVLSEGRYK